MSDRSGKQVDDDADAIVVRDASGRRRFIRTGTAFLVAGTAALAAGGVRADDCDRGNTEAAAKKAAAGSDSDAGANADPAGCGRRPPPSISRAPAPADDTGVTVVKVRT